MPKRKTITAKNLKLTKSKDKDLFPYESFPYRLDHKDGKTKKVCHFQCDDHLIKYIERHKLLEKDYVAKYYINPK